MRLHHELWGPGSSSSDWDEAQAQDGQGRTGDDGQGGVGKVPLGQGRVGQVPVKLNCNSFLFLMLRSNSVMSTFIIPN